MRLVLLGHPPSLGSESMPRFAGMIQRGMAARGHSVELWTSQSRLGRLPVPSALARKWLGYADQFLLYPRALRRRVEQQPADTVFAVTDQALGMWVPGFAHRPHVIHCHDFLALRSALGEFPENRTGWTGQQYQRLIRKGFSQGKAFISVSEKTREDLHRFLPQKPKISEVVYNGLNYPFRPMEPAESIDLLEKTGVEISEAGHVLHVGGNQWYKNRRGVLEIYRTYAATCPRPAALWLVGATLPPELLELAATIPPPGRVHFLNGLDNAKVNAAYSQARVLLFPSLDEGFGWPIVEGMASACPVITTNLAPMTEVAGNAARFIPRVPVNAMEQAAWAKSAAAVLAEVVNMDEDTRANLLEQGRLNAARFDTETAMNSYERIYERALAESRK
jgi:glycosyltransferase involved in cell wall biosynthesis